MKIELNMYLVPLTQDKFAIVDAEGWEKVKDLKWCYSSLGYSCFSTYDKKTKKRGRIYMHRFLVDTPKGMHTDHINGDKLDNRLINLRICTNFQNSKNSKPKHGTSKYKGVYWQKNRSKWVSRITYDYKGIHLGCFDNEIEAAKAYDIAAVEYFGEYARINNV